MGGKKQRMKMKYKWIKGWGKISTENQRKGEKQGNGENEIQNWTTLEI